MTNPTEPHEPSDPSEAAPVTGGGEVGATGGIPPVPPQPLPPAGQLPPGYGAPQWAAQSPFMPVVKQPWFNPAKRTSILVSAIVAAIVLLGSGVLIGMAANHDGHRDRGGMMYIGPAGGRVFVPGNGQAPRFRFPGNGNGNGQRKLPPAASSVPSSAPSTGTS